MATNRKTVEGIYRDGKVELLETPADRKSTEGFQAHILMDSVVMLENVATVLMKLTEFLVT